MGEKTEVGLKLNQGDLFEYWTNAVPRVGERMDISHEDAEGVYLVSQVTYHVFENKNGDVLNYVTVNLEEE